MQLQGDTHTETLLTRGSLASFTGRAGNPATAQEILTQLVPVCEQLGLWHPAALLARHYSLLIKAMQSG